MYGEQPTTDSEEVFEDISAFVQRFKEARAKHEDLQEKERKEREKRAQADKRARDKEASIALAASHAKNPPPEKVLFQFPLAMCTRFVNFSVCRARIHLHPNRKSCQSSWLNRLNRHKYKRQLRQPTIRLHPRPL